MEQSCTKPSLSSLLSSPPPISSISKYDLSRSENRQSIRVRGHQNTRCVGFPLAAALSAARTHHPAHLINDSFANPCPSSKIPKPLLPGTPTTPPSQISYLQTPSPLPIVNDTATDSHAPTAGHLSSAPASNCLPTAQRRECQVDKHNWYVSPRPSYFMHCAGGHTQTSSRQIRTKHWCTVSSRGTVASISSVSCISTLFV